MGCTLPLFYILFALLSRNKQKEKAAAEAAALWVVVYHLAAFCKPPP